MDLGALVCLPRRPLCPQCPVRKFCAATDPVALPRKKPKPRQVLLDEPHGFALRRDRVLLEQSQHPLARHVDPATARGDASAPTASPARTSLSPIIASPSPSSPSRRRNCLTNTCAGSLCLRSPGFRFPRLTAAPSPSFSRDKNLAALSPALNFPVLMIQPNESA